MGIDASLIHHLGLTSRRHHLRGRLCTLGVQEIRAGETTVARALDAAGVAGTGSDLYARLGFDAVESVDVSGFEGCTHLLDLNTPGVPHALRQRFDVVYNGGTLEHVFDVRTALRNVYELLRIGGLVVHVSPVDGWVDHGFYQISPTLLADYYHANRFDILEMRLIETSESRPDEAMSHPYIPGEPMRPRSADPASRSLLYASFRKRPDSTWDAVPHQRHYATIYGSPADIAAAPLLRYWPSVTLRAGVPADPPLFQHALPPVVHAEGFEWVAPLAHLRHIADDVSRRRSSLVLFEDGDPIGPPHALHADIRALGGGRYSHWGNELRFSSSGNDDARSHAYSYACRVEPEG
jgi:SAM-dependent methyltransferase